MNRQMGFLLAALLFAGGYALRGQHSKLPAESVRFSRGDWIALGELPPGTHEVAFALENVGSSSVHLRKVVGSCTCAAVDVHAGEIAAGRALPVKVRLTVTPSVRREAMVFFHLESDAGNRSVRPVSITFSGGSCGSIAFEPGAVEGDAALPGTVLTWPVTAVYRSPEGGAVDVQEVGVWTVRSPHEWTILRAPLERTQEGLVFRATLVSTPLQPGELRQGSLQLTVGLPPRASSSIPLRLRARDDIGLVPSVLSFRRDSEHNEQAVAADVRCRLPEGWMVDRVEVDPWIECIKRDDKLFRIGLSGQLNRDLAVGAVRFHVVANASGERAALVLRVSYEEVP